MWVYPFHVTAGDTLTFYHVGLYLPHMQKKPFGFNLPFGRHGHTCRANKLLQRPGLFVGQFLMNSGERVLNLLQTAFKFTLFFKFILFAHSDHGRGHIMQKLQQLLLTLHRELSLFCPGPSYFMHKWFNIQGKIIQVAMRWLKQFMWDATQSFV